MRDREYRMRRAGRGMMAGVLLAAFSAAAQDAGVEISGFRVPEYDRNGVMTAQLFGEHAQVLPDGDVKITGLRLEFYREGVTVAVVESPYCFYNQKTRQARSDAPVEADMGQVLVTGRGFTVHPGDKTVEILNESRVVINDIMQQAGRGPGDADMSGETVITSRRLRLAYEEGVARFSEDVHVADPRLAIDCGMLEVRVGESREIDWIEAQTDVRIFYEEREARAGKAVYDIRSDEFLLEQDPVLLSGRSRLSGERMRFSRSDGRMVCEPSARLVIYPEDAQDWNFTGN